MPPKVIKGGGKAGAGGGRFRPVADPAQGEGAIVHRRVLDAREKALEIIAAAEADADSIRQQAREVLEQAGRDREAAVKQGYAEGESKGLQQVTEKLLQLGQLRERFYEQAEPEIVKLVMEIAEKVIGRIAEEHAGLIRSVVRQALDHALGDRITITMNPEDRRALAEKGQGLSDIVDRTKRLVLREDDGVARGGCIVETEVGTIDARLETQLEAIRKALNS